MVKNRKASLGKSAIEALFTSIYCFSKKLLHGSQKVKEKKKKKNKFLPDKALWRAGEAGGNAPPF